MLYEVLTEEQLNELENKNKETIEGNELIKSFIQESKSAAAVRTMSYSRVAKIGVAGAGTTATTAAAAATAVAPATPSDGVATAAAVTAAAEAESRRVAKAEAAAAAAAALDREMDLRKRRCNIIIEGIKEEGRMDERNDWDAIEDIFSYLGCYDRGYDIEGVPVRLGDKNFIKYGNNRKPRRYPRLLKVVFNSERAANEVLRCSTKLKNHYLYGHIYIKRDKSREERMAEYAARRKPWGDTQAPEQSEADNVNREANNRAEIHRDNEGRDQNASRVINDRSGDGRNERQSDNRGNGERIMTVERIGGFVSSARIIDNGIRDDRGAQGVIVEGINSSSTTSEGEVNESGSMSEGELSDSEDSSDDLSGSEGTSDSEDTPRETMVYGSQEYIVRSQIVEEIDSSREEIEGHEGSETEGNRTEDVNRDEDMGNDVESENNGGG